MGSEEERLVSGDGGAVAEPAAAKSDEDAAKIPYSSLGDYLKRAPVESVRAFVMDQVECLSCRWLPDFLRYQKESLGGVFTKAYLMDMLRPKQWFGVFLTVTLIIIGSTNRVMFRIMLQYMNNYLYSVNLISTLVYLPIFWPLVWGLMFYGTIDRKMRSFPLYKFAVMGFLDSTAGFMMVFGGSQVSGPLQQLLMQAVIPFIIFFSWFASLYFWYFIFRKLLIEAEYRVGHIIGASIIVCGLILALVPSFTGGDNSGSSAFGVTMFFLANIPNAISGVYKEIAFKGDVDLDVNYVNAWVSTWQFAWSLVFMPIVAVLPAEYGGVPFSDIPSNLLGFCKCFVGINTQADDDCKLAGLFTVGYLMANIVYNIVILAIIKYISAVLLYVASAVIMPVANFAFAIKWIMPSAVYVALTYWNIGGLVVILFGLFVYRIAGMSGRPALKEGEEYDVVLQPGSLEPALVVRQKMRPEHLPRTTQQIRHEYLYRLGVMPPESMQQQRASYGGINSDV